MLGTQGTISRASTSPLLRQDTICIIVLCGLLTGLGLFGCTAPPDASVVSTYRTGEYGIVRTKLQPNMQTKRSDRNYLLDRVRVGMLTLADGYPEGAQQIFNQIYDLLRTQGINEDRTVVSVIFNEDLKIWKGEPFEQALTLNYIGIQMAMLDSWDNARAASRGSLFYLRDFGKNKQGEPLSNKEIVDKTTKDEDFIETGYVPVKSNFTLGYMLAGIANQQLQRDAEAQDFFRQAVSTNAGMTPLVQRLNQGTYNTILFVDYGQGPQKIGTGPDNAIARFIAKTPSDNRPLIVTQSGSTARWSIVTDVNQMAQDHRWNNLEDMRVARSYIGTGLVAAGVATTTIGADQNSTAAVIAGVGMIAAGAFAKAGAHADTRYCEAMPQRVYIVPLTITEPDTQVTLQVDGINASRLTTTLDPPPDGTKAQASYIRLLTRSKPLNWTTNTNLVYANVYDTAISGRMLPYILGGNDVRPPTYEVMKDYHDAGYLRDLRLQDLESMYKAEGIRYRNLDTGYPGRHVLEGGNSLAAPQPGSTGYNRLFHQRHPTYVPKSQRVRDLYNQLRETPQPAS